MIQRKIQSELESLIRSGQSILLLGPRQTGKTTLLRTIPSSLFISLANPRERLEYERDPSRLEREVRAASDRTEAGRRPLVILDEIQKVPELMDAIQVLIDGREAQFILTGSSARKLKRSHDVNLLPGRVVSMRLDPLSLSEGPSRPLDEHILYGDLPAISLEKRPGIRAALLRTYVEAYLEEEVKAEALVRRIGPFARFLEMAAIDSGRVVNFSAVSKQVGPSVHTIQSYYDVLVDCLVAERIEPITASATRKRLTRSPKILLFDLGVRRLAAREGIRLIPERMGELFEQWIGLELLRLSRTAACDARLHFWRDPDGPEVDWVISRDGAYVPVEVKWTERPSPADGKHLNTFLREYPQATEGFVVCRITRPQRLTDRVRAIPWEGLGEVFL